MAKWIDSRANKKNTSILSKLQESHKQYVKENRDYLKAQRGHDEQRESLSNSSDVNRGNFLELIHLRCKDIAWLKDKLESLLQKHTQWTSPVIQNEQLQIIADLRKKHSLVSTPQNQPKVKYCMNWWNLLSLNSILISRTLLVKHSMGRLIWTVYTRDSQQEYNGRVLPTRYLRPLLRTCA